MEDDILNVVVYCLLLIVYLSMSHVARGVTRTFMRDGLASPAEIFSTSIYIYTYIHIYIYTYMHIYILLHLPYSRLGETGSYNDGKLRDCGDFDSWLV
jgi:membrane-anchored glycerophosphoryl diester phosphodiesterase (GDPDase)